MDNVTFYNAWKEMLLSYEEELQFLEFNRLVPIIGNSPETFSIRLYDILQSTCGQVESMKLLCERLDLKYPTKENNGRHPNFLDFLHLSTKMKL